MNSAGVAQSVSRHLLRFAGLALLVAIPVAGAWAQSTELAPPRRHSPLMASDLSIWGLFWSAPFRRQDRDDRPAGLLGLGLGDRGRQDAALHAHQESDGSVRAGLLVRPVAGGALSLAVGAPAHSMAALFVAAMREWKRSFEGRAAPSAGLQMRIEKVMDVTIAREIERLERRLLVLATVGSAGPFIGLFGTVWGIMNSFQSIAASKNTSLAVVAPGIAEALFATAIGLVAAIPATIFYNKFVSEVNKQAHRLEGFADEFSAILSRQIDERG